MAGTKKGRAKEIFQDSHIYELLAEESPNWIYILVNNKIIYGNKKFLKEIGYKREIDKNAGANLSNLINKPDRKRILLSLKNAIKHRITPPVEYHLIKDNGETVDVVQINRVIRYLDRPALFSLLIPVADLPGIYKTKKALQESEESYRLMIENSTEVIYKTDLKGNYTYANKFFLNKTGYNASEILKMNCFELIPKEYQDEVRKVYSKQLNNKARKIVSYEMPCIGKNKNVFWVSQHSKIEQDKFGKPIGFSLTARDITEKHETEEALNQERRELKEDYKTLIERMHEGIVRVDLNETILYVNKRFCEMHGYNESEVMGKNIVSLLGFDDESITNVRSAFLLRKKGKPSSYHVRAKKKSGAIVWCSINGSPLYQDGKVIGSMGIVMDITQEVQAKKALMSSEDNLKKAQEIGHLGSYDWNFQANTLVWNQQMYEIYGVTRGVKPTIDLATKLTHPDDIKNMEEAINKAIKGKSKQRYEYRIKRKDGTIRYCMARSKMFFDDAGLPYRVIGTIQDITEQKLAEQQIKELNESLEKRVIERTEQLEKANKEIRALLQEMHHRVKNNLQIVSSLMNLQANSIQEREIAEVFEESRDRIQAMAILHENLYMNESVSEINLKEYIKPLIHGRIRAYKGRGSKININLDVPDTNFNIDIVLPIGLLLNELVTNSIKHAFPNENQGAISLEIKKKRGSNYQLKYRDNGIGFKEEQNKDLQRLGLVLIDTFVLQLEGKLKRNSNSKGTEYILTFPIG